MARHGLLPVRAVAGVQVRYATSLTGEEYVTRKAWEMATIADCPWHPDADCGFCRHGTYERVTPVGCLIPRWYCPLARHTVSALPDCMAARRMGTLVELERRLVIVEQSATLERASEAARPEIELPGALRYLVKLRRDVHAALVIVRGLYPERFGTIAPTITAFAALLGVAWVLVALRGEIERRHLPRLPAPLGFDPRRDGRNDAAETYQHRAGHDPPRTFVEARLYPSHEFSIHP